MTGKTRSSGSTRERSSPPAFTLIEVLVVVAIIALLIAILIPSLARAREMSRRAVCASRLHNMALAIQEYAQANKGKIIQCRGGTVQVAIDPRLASPTSPSAATDPDSIVDWQGGAKRYHLDKEMWECPNRQGSFLYEGSPSLVEQGYTAATLRSMGYTVADSGTDYDQWIIGFQYFGGIRQWENPRGKFKSRSPIDSNSRPSWALAADSNLLVDNGWGRGRETAYGRMPPHPDPSGKPAGGSVLTFDGAVNWIIFGRMLSIHSWENSTRQGYWWQADLGDYGRQVALNRGG